MKKCLLIMTFFVVLQMSVPTMNAGSYFGSYKNKFRFPVLDWKSKKTWAYVALFSVLFFGGKLLWGLRHNRKSISVDSDKKAERYERDLFIWMNFYNDMEIGHPLHVLVNLRDQGSFKDSLKWVKMHGQHCYESSDNEFISLTKSPRSSNDATAITRVLSYSGKSVKGTKLEGELRSSSASLETLEKKQTIKIKSLREFGIEGSKMTDSEAEKSLLYVIRFMIKVADFAGDTVFVNRLSNALPRSTKLQISHEIQSL